jgi:protease I
MRKKVHMEGRLVGKKIVIVVAQEFEDVELLYPVLRFSEEGAEIVVVPVRKRSQFAGTLITGRFGHTVPVQVMREGNRYRISNLEEIKADEVDCLYFPGGYSPDTLRWHAGTLELTRECHRRGKLLATICHSPWILISAGVLKGKRATGYDSVRDDMANAGATVVDLPVVRDGNIITGRVPDNLPEFCQEIIKAISA